MQMATEFDFDSVCNTPYVSAPSSPQRFGSYFSAPSSPTLSSSFNFRNNPAIQETENPTQTNNNDDHMDFAFDFTAQSDTPSLSADELFHYGKIKPLPVTNSPKTNRRNKTEFSSFSENTTEDNSLRAPNNSSSMRISDILFESENDQQISATPIPTSSSTWYKNWKLKDLLLFRSASEGRPIASKDPSKNSALLRKNINEDVKNSSFRSTDSANSGSSGPKRKKPAVSAHELHYRMNREMAQEMRRKTFLPYKQVLFGC